MNLGITVPINIDASSDNSNGWLKRYYFIRSAFSIVWVAVTLTLGTKEPAIAGALLVFYPAWDAISNWIDGRRGGGLSANATQRINVWVSSVTTIAVALELKSGMSAVLAVVGMWAIASGLLQLATALRRWKIHGAQWVMVLSGAQSALAGGLFVAQSRTATPPSIVNVAGYAGVGALYFLLSAAWLVVGDWRRAKRRAT